MTGCKKGYYGLYCNQSCPNGTFGDECAGRCPLGCDNKDCNHVTGCKKYTNNTTPKMLTTSGMMK